MELNFGDNGRNTGKRDEDTRGSSGGGSTAAKGGGTPASLRMLAVGALPTPSGPPHPHPLPTRKSTAGRLWPSHLVLRGRGCLGGDEHPATTARVLPAVASPEGDVEGGGRGEDGDEESSGRRRRPPPCAPLPHLLRPTNAVVPVGSIQGLAAPQWPPLLGSVISGLTWGWSMAGLQPPRRRLQIPPSMSRAAAARVHHDSIWFSPRVRGDENGAGL
jgi:hypothetical protein